ncbi:Unknown protein, partial [Striga hermonthica]
RRVPFRRPRVSPFNLSLPSRLFNLATLCPSLSVPSGRHLPGPQLISTRAFRLLRPGGMLSMVPAPGSPILLLLIVQDHSDLSLCWSAFLFFSLLFLFSFLSFLFYFESVDCV